MPSAYEQDVNIAEHVFLYQRVFCPWRERLVMLNDPGRNLDAAILSKIGDEMEDEIACQVAEGRINPITKVPFDADPQCADEIAEAVAADQLDKLMDEICGPPDAALSADALPRPATQLPLPKSDAELQAVIGEVVLQMYQYIQDHDNIDDRIESIMMDRTPAGLTTSILQALQPHAVISLGALPLAGVPGLPRNAEWMTAVYICHLVYNDNDAVFFGTTQNLRQRLEAHHCGFTKEPRSKFYRAVKDCREAGGFEIWHRATMSNIDFTLARVCQAVLVAIYNAAPGSPFSFVHGNFLGLKDSVVLVGDAWTNAKERLNVQAIAASVERVIPVTGKREGEQCSAPAKRRKTIASEGTTHESLSLAIAAAIVDYPPEVGRKFAFATRADHIGEQQTAPAATSWQRAIAEVVRTMWDLMAAGTHISEQFVSYLQQTTSESLFDQFLAATSDAVLRFEGLPVLTQWNAPRSCGVYACVIKTTDGDTYLYIGSSKNVKKRLRQHQSGIRRPSQFFHKVVALLRLQAKVVSETWHLVATAEDERTVRLFETILVALYRCCPMSPLPWTFGEYVGLNRSHVLDDGDCSLETAAARGRAGIAARRVWCLIGEAC
jgi:predicted GIY-YIG superfamily endonuclease